MFRPSAAQKLAITTFINSHPFVHGRSADRSLLDESMNLEDWMLCRNCNQHKSDHMDDGKCFFEASHFDPVPLPDITTISMVYQYDSSSEVRPSKPFPERTKYEKRKEQRLKMKAPRRR